MKISKQKLENLVENSILENLLSEASVYQDPAQDLFDTAHDAVSALGSSLPADHPAYQKVEDMLMLLMDAHIEYFGK